MHAKVFSIQIFQYFHQILPRVCTLVLFVLITYSRDAKYVFIYDINDAIYYVIFLTAVFCLFMILNKLQSF